MKHLWENLSDTQKRGLVVGSLLGILALFIYLIMPRQDETKKLPQGPTIKHVLTDTNTRDVSLNSLSAQLKRLELANDQLKKEVSTLYQETQYLKKLQQNAERQAKNDIHTLNAEASVRSESLTSVSKRQAEALTANELIIQPDEQNARSNGIDTQGNSHEETGFSLNHNRIRSTSKVNDILPYYQSIEPNRRFFNGIENHQSSILNPMEHLSTTESFTIKTITQPELTLPVENEVLAEPIRLLAGSIIQGRLITGMDAPTHDSAKREPFPALLRIKKEAILPNRNRSDIRECFLIMGGYGDLSSERAYLRGETLSCILDNDKVIETPLEGFAAGEDGKAGIRGRLVSKQGQLVAKSMMAGFLQGLSGAFDVNPVPSIQTSDIGRNQLYQSVMSSDALQGAAIKGTGKALDRIAKFYLDMAENMFPVIEIDAAREIEIIVTRGVTL